MPAPAFREPAKPAPALGLIVGYKLVRCGLSLLLALGLAVMLLSGHAGSVAQLAVQVRHHFSSGFGSSLADSLLRGFAPARLWFVVGALAFDALLTGVEGFALQTGKRWGEWLVVVATAALVPFETVGLVRTPHVGRAILLVLNVAVAVYLLRRALREER